MVYPDEFKEKVLCLLNDNEGIKTRLEEGNEIIGKYLDIYRCIPINPQEVISAYKNNDFELLYKKAQRQLAFEELYSEWLKLYNDYKITNTEEKSIFYR